MPKPAGPRYEINRLLADAIQEEKEHPNNEEAKVRIETLQEVLGILEKSARYGYRPTPTEANERKSTRNTFVNRAFIDASIHRHAHYTQEELAVVADLSLNNVQVAVKLGRTPKGIGHQRRKMRQERSNTTQHSNS